MPPPRPIVPTMSRLSSGNCSRVCLRRCESGRGPLPESFDVNASLNGSRMPWAAYSNVSNCCITGSGSSGGAGRALTLATHSSRFDAGSGPLVTLRPQAPSTRARPTASAPRTRLFDMRMSLPSLGVRRGCRGRGGLFLVEVAVGFHRTGELEAGVGADRGGGVLVGVHRPQRDVVHRHDHHARQRGHAADEGAELVVDAHHLQRDRLLGVELLGRFRPGLEHLVLDAGGQRDLRDVDDQVRHFSLARQLAQHLLQLLLHLRELLLERLQVGGAALLLDEVVAQFGLALVELFELVALVAGDHPPQQAEDQRAEQHAEADLVRPRPAAGVVDVELAELHFSLAHDAAPSVAAAAGAAPSEGASPTGGTASGTPSPSSSLAALGLARVTVSENAYGSPFTAPVASMIDSSGMVIQPEPSRLRM